MPRKLRNEDFSDRELLHLINDLAKSDKHGFVTTAEVAEQLAFSNGDHRAVVTRMIWMKRLGYLDRIDPRELGLRASEAPRYAITPAGKAVMGGRLNRAIQKSLQSADAGTSVLIIREVAEQGYVRGDRATANATRRQWLHTSAKRPR